MQGRKMSNFRVTTGKDGSRSFYGEHDDRDRYPSDSGRSGGRRGPDKSYNRRSNRGGIYKRGKGLNPRTRIDDDVDMGDSGGSQRQRYNPYGSRKQPYGGRKQYGKMAMDREVRVSRGRSSGGGNRNRVNRSRNQGGRDPFYVRESSTGWYKVQVLFASKVEKKQMLELINSNLNVPFVPISYHLLGNDAIFHVNNYDTAKALKGLHKAVSMPNGYKMSLIIRTDALPPQTDMTAEVIEKVKVSMSNRYDPATKALNLSKMSHDSDLNKEHIHLTLNKGSIMRVVLNIIQENIPELVSLDLSNNRLMTLEHMSEIAVKAPNVVKLDLRANNLKATYDLHKITGLKLEELHLEGNPLCDKYDDETSYVSAVRKHFPKVMKLDGHSLPAPVVFDIEESTTLPPSKGSYFINEDIQKQVCLFLEQYIKIYDSGNRQQLLEAYHDDAVFSMCCSYNKQGPSRQNLADYTMNSRNMFKVHSGVRHKLLKHGRVNVVSMMSELPSSEHDLASFVVDVVLVTPDLMTFTLRGIFRETSTKSDSPPIRYFSRTFVTVPQGSGIVIMNEMYTIMPASQKQVKEAFRTPAPTPSSSPVISAGTSAGPSPGPSVAATPAAPGGVLTPELKLEMVQQFSLQSRMNLAYSQRCLEENNWDYDASARVFVELQAKGSIPAEAFVQ